MFVLHMFTFHIPENPVYYSTNICPVCLSVMLRDVIVYAFLGKTGAPITMRLFPFYWMSEG